MGIQRFVDAGCTGRHRLQILALVRAPEHAEHPRERGPQLPVPAEFEPRF